MKAIKDDKYRGIVLVFDGFKLTESSVELLLPKLIGGCTYAHIQVMGFITEHQRTINFKKG